jgi:hypothetical protein
VTLGTASPGDEGLEAAREGAAEDALETAAVPG